MKIELPATPKGLFYLLDIEADEYNLDELIDGLATIPQVADAVVSNGGPPWRVFIRLEDGVDFRDVREALRVLAKQLS